MEPSELVPFEWSGERVVTFEQIAQVHGVPVKNVQRRYQEHAERFVDGKHTYLLDFAECQNLLSVGFDTSPRGMRVFTEKGYFLLVKPMRDEMAWSVYERMVEEYFRYRAFAQSQQHIPASAPWEVALEKVVHGIGSVLATKADKQDVDEALNAQDLKFDSRLDAERRATNQQFGAHEKRMNSISDDVDDLKKTQDSMATVAAGPVVPPDSGIMVATVWDFLLNRKAIDQVPCLPIPFVRAMQAFMEVEYTPIEPPSAVQRDGKEHEADPIYRNEDLKEAFERCTEYGTPNLRHLSPHERFKAEVERYKLRKVPPGKVYEVTRSAPKEGA